MKRKRKCYPLSAYKNVDILNYIEKKKSYKAGEIR